MRLPRTLTVSVVVVTALVGLAGCGDASSSSPAAGGSSSPTAGSTTPSSGGSAVPTVTGGFGETPTVTVPDSDPPADLQVKVLEPGDGPKVESGDLLVADYVGMTWDGDQPFDSSFERGQPAAFTIGVQQVIPGWDQALVGQQVGSRLLLVIPPDLGYGDNPPSNSGIEAGATLVFVVDIVDSVAPDASAHGKATPWEDDGVPALTVNKGEPDLTIPPGPAPDTLQVHAVVTGSGRKVEKGDLIVVQYVGKVWRNGKLFDSSWQRGSAAGFAIGVGGMIPGWDQALVGQTVGSRVLIVVPPDLAYGNNPPSGSGIKAGDTLVFGVDILGAY